jgi:hypothetical protein
MSGSGGTPVRKMMRKVRRGCDSKMGKNRPQWFPSYDEMGKILKGMSDRYRKTVNPRHLWTSRDPNRARLAGCLPELS